MDTTQKIEILNFEGSSVDPWLAGLAFEATIPPEGKGITIRPIGPNAHLFLTEKYDRDMWLEWCRRFAYKIWRKNNPPKRTKSRPKPELVAKRKVIAKVTKNGKKMDLVQVKPEVPLDLTQAFKLVPAKKVPAKRKRK